MATNTKSTRRTFIKGAGGAAVAATAAAPFVWIPRMSRAGMDIPADSRNRVIYINLDGGALAMGHPLGATGARITGKTAALLRREGKQFGLATQCIGGGQGIATVLEAA